MLMSLVSHAYMHNTHTPSEVYILGLNCAHYMQDFVEYLLL